MAAALVVMSLRTMSDPCDGTNWLSLGCGNTTMSLSKRWKLATFQPRHQQPKGMASSHVFALENKNFRHDVAGECYHCAVNVVVESICGRCGAKHRVQRCGRKPALFSFSTSRRTTHRHLPVCMVASEALQFSPPAFLHHQIGWAHPPTVTKVDARSRDSTWLKNKLIQVSHGVTTTEQTYRKGWERTHGGRYRMSAAGDAGRATHVTRWKEHGQCRHWHAVPPPTFFIACRPMLIRLEDRHLVKDLQCQWAWFFANCAKPCRQTKIK